MSTRILVAYATKAGCDSSCAADIANEIADVPDLEVDVQPIAGVGSIAPYAAVYLGWGHPSTAGQRELDRFLNRNAALLASRPIWIVHRHPGCAQDSRRGMTKLTRLVATAQRRATPPVPAARPVAASARSSV